MPIYQTQRRSTAGCEPVNFVQGATDLQNKRSNRPGVVFARLDGHPPTAARTCTPCSMDVERTIIDASGVASPLWALVAE